MWRGSSGRVSTAAVRGAARPQQSQRVVARRFGGHAAKEAPPPATHFPPKGQHDPKLSPGFEHAKTSLPEEIEILPEFRNSFSVDVDPTTKGSTALAHLGTMAGVLGGFMGLAYLVNPPARTKLAPRDVLFSDDNEE